MCADTHTYVDGGYMELPNPPYPEHARLKNEQGIVKLRVQVAPNNRIRLVEVAESSGSPLLDEAAVAAVHQYRFQAASRDGKRVATTFFPIFKFELE
ncbi:energy transducer TonB [Kingella oralis]|uniref:energy transducer TonB n=1 Tax=Kingella oralis TaxID=505 RepID=UPI0034E47BA8